MCMYVEVRVYISVYVSRCNNVYVFLCLSMSIYPHVCISISVYIYTVFKVINQRHSCCAQHSYSRVALKVSAVYAVNQLFSSLDDLLLTGCNKGLVRTCFSMISGAFQSAI